MAAPIPRRMPIPSIQATRGEPSAAIRSAMITGMVSSAKNSTPRKSAYVAMPITIRRHAHAAARSRPHGTWAGEKFEGPFSIGHLGARLGLAQPLMGEPSGEPLPRAVVAGRVGARRGVVAHGVQPTRPPARSGGGRVGGPRPDARRPGARPLPST